jgi:hypothetical protein
MTEIHDRLGVCEPTLSAALHRWSASGAIPAGLVRQLRQTSGAPRGRPRTAPRTEA